MSSGFILLFILAAIGPVAAGNCNTAPDVDGCSVKVNRWDLPPFFWDIFEPGCNKHDICYSCGAYYGVSRRLCDDHLYANNKKLCSTNTKVRHLSWCLQFAREYYLVWINFKHSYYKQTSPGWCSQSYVADCIF
ncbi:hypothetical protein MAR_027422 [Mya arenaria]|uniref:Conodipine-M alpha chain n=1 Tax=Mya arenaria TaxID=6604 RepID=A0ABY7EWG5_MYAAR|nr:hypothetical protein MAR_027422 [Mya arenaria]